MKLRHGFTLIEMVTAITVGSVLLVLAMTMVQNTMHTESKARKQSQTQRTATRLSRQFRYDVHQAREISIDRESADGVVLQLTFEDQFPVSYRVSDHSVQRQQQLDQQRTRREVFVFPEQHKIQFDQMSEPSRAVLTVKHDTQLVGVSAQLKLQIEAVIGQFQQLSQAQASVR